MKKIILVEDDESIRDVFHLALQSENYQITGYESGSTILSNDAEVPDLFVLDKNISGMNGLELCRYIKNSDKYRQVPVILVSASPDITKVYKEFGAEDALEKPFSLKGLRAIVAKYV